MKPTLRETVQQQRKALEATLSEPLASLAAACAPHWPDRETLDDILTEHLKDIPNCTFLYALTTQGMQITDNISHSGLLPEHFGRDRSQRPYMKEAVPASGFLLSEAYISLRAQRPSLTALQLVKHHDAVLGFVGADFDLRNLPVTAELYDEPTQWRQIKGDAAIRGTLFQQTRIDSLLDKDIDQAMSILRELIQAHGMFQCVLHFSSSRAEDKLQSCVPSTFFGREWPRAWQPAPGSEFAYRRMRSAAGLTQIDRRSCRLLSVMANWRPRG